MQSIITHVRGLPVAENIVDCTAPGGAALVPSTSSVAAAGVCGVAYCGGGHAVARVEVSIDEGLTWDSAEIIDYDKPEALSHKPEAAAAAVMRSKSRKRISGLESKQWEWVLWQSDVDMDRAKSVMVRAFDSLGHGQATTGHDALVANPTGYFFNSPHRVKLN
jgi:hypothetical protein